MGDIQPVEVDVPQPAGLSGEVLPTDGVHNDQHRAGLFRGGDIGQVGIVSHRILVLGGE